jgi:hypothetical protein
MLKRMFVKRGMTIRLNGKDPEGKVRGAILLGYGDLFVNFFSAFYVRLDLFNLIQTRYFHNNLLIKVYKMENTSSIRYEKLP